MKVLVTGAAGFIGSTLVDRLLHSGYEVIGVDCFTDYYFLEQKSGNILAALKNPKFRFIGNPISAVDWEAILPDVSHIYHLAGQPGVRASWGQEFKEYVDQNVLATQILLEACLRHAPRLLSFVYASTSSVYGLSNARPYTEDTRPQPISPYGVTKLAAEHLCLLYQHSYGLPITVVRYFTVYGPRQRPDMAFHIFLKAAMEAKPIKVFGDGQQRRDFTYVTDAVDGTIRASTGRHGGVYNIGGGSQVTLNFALGIIGSVTGATLEIKNDIFQRGDMRDTHADITEARVDLDYRPKVLLVDGIREEYKWLLSHYQGDLVVPYHDVV
jgi:nucleoside-diphosphate-sugar epimerase